MGSEEREDKKRLKELKVNVLILRLKQGIEWKEKNYIFDLFFFFMWQAEGECGSSTIIMSVKLALS